jgi:hypothetical protein
MKATTITATLVAALLFSAGGASPGWSQDTGRNFVVKTVQAERVDIGPAPSGYGLRVVF